MGKPHVRHLVEQKSGYYFQPSKSMRKHGFNSEPLGTGLAAAVTRAEELNAEYDIIRRGNQPRAVLLPAQGTVSRYIHDLKQSTAYLDKSLGRQAELDRTLPVIERIFGGKRLNKVTAVEAEAFYVRLREKKSQSFAARVLKDMRFLFNRAIKQNIIVYNPALAFTVTQPEPRTQKWEPDQVERAIKVGWDAGFRGAAVALAIAYDTGLSSADIRALTVGEVISGAWIGARTKTGVGYSVKLWPETLKLIEQYHDYLGVTPMPEALVVRSRRGKPFLKHRLSRDVRIILDKAGISKEIQMRDLRRTAASEIVEGGATDAELEAAFGVSSKTSGKWRETYAPASEAMADNARMKRNKNSPVLKV
jgi:integrase